MTMKSYKIVYVPADTSEPLQEWTIKSSEEKLLESLLDRLKAHFKATGPKKTAEQEAQQHKELMKSLPEGTKVDAAMLRVATNMQMVENIALLANAPEYGFVGVNLYVDDQGSIKQLPLNLRASDIANVAGKPMEVRGDAFLARVLDDGEAFDRLDLTVSEVSSSARWVKDAAEQNRRKAGSKQSEELAARMQASVSAADRARSGAQASSSGAGKAVVTEEVSPAEAAKAAGNKAFARGDFVEAVLLYSEALSKDGSLVTALNNRALAHLKLGNPAAAETDASAVLHLEPRNVKALLRRGNAREALGQVDSALQDFKAALIEQPNNKEAAERIDHLVQLTMQTLPADEPLDQ
mmetsp:Transcript_9973/g.29916  ORF Transcript_9973/g.29916 Transcript_9973/m.29916 type:complete len:352 (-) Transcript_9973:950-2005(-)|eukprot:CAMPEP_0206145086 /NCGR_PEP_ID=MMETSP1473-20131121/26297_1 /ASSEMBLY_ACC=CAM_ASM_001109 /TAXON_ID=1461547 /ORGANISM="Stichococcus sp, Strain RCC1054" /LENGTH=351 /DNA_ID=CAMNT_0053541153 /DNA_START=159 /DNA_END=1214 /DNA_ORIENTATION=+